MRHTLLRNILSYGQCVACSGRRRREASCPTISGSCADCGAVDDSYQVPKEVGKIGNESPTFVQPIAERKDGIEAMFAKQLRKEPSAASRTTPRKRSRSPTDVTGAEADAEADAAVSKKAKVEKLNAWEDDSEIEYVDEPPVPGVPQVPVPYPLLAASRLLARISRQIHRPRNAPA